MIVLDSGYQWIPFYEELADKLLAYKDNRNELFDLVKKLSSEQPLMQYFHFERDDWWGPRHYQIDPFSVVGVMNRGANDKNRAILGKVLADAFDVKTPVPTEFAGIPVLSSLSSIISGNEELWDLFVLAMQATEKYEFPPEFSKVFEKAIAVSGNGLGKITMALYWVRPYLFMPLDSKSRPYLSSTYGISISKKRWTGSDYINFLIDLKKVIDIKSPGVSFPEVSFSAWMEREVKPSEKTDDPPEITEGVPQKELISEEKISAQNIILYGAPGTGKTYSSIEYAVAIIEGKPIAEVKAEGYEAVFKRYLKYKDYSAPRK